MPNQLPINLEAEQFLLSSYLIDPHLTHENTNAMITETDFYKEAHRVIYRHIMKFVNDMSNLDITTLMESLRVSKEYDNVGGPSYITGLMKEEVTAFMAIEYAQIVRHCSQLRKAIMLAGQLMQMAYDRKEIQEVITTAEKGLVTLGGDFANSEVLTAQDVANLTLKKIDNARAEEGEFFGVPTGFNNLDDMIEGLHDSSLNILAARPAMGKSAFAMAITENIVYSQDKNVLFISLEMDVTQLCIRTISSRTRINSQEIRKGDIDDGQYSRVVNALGEYSEKGILMYENSTTTLEAVKSVVRRQFSKHGLDLVIIDYLQIMDVSGKGTREQDIASLSRGLKRLAMEINIPILALSQLSRNLEQRNDKRPILSDLRDSGAIEQDADTVTFSL